MSECANDDIRDGLPDFAADRLSAAERTRVAAHVAACAACAAEVEVLRVARQVTSRGVPAMDVARIVAALPAPPAATGRAPARTAPTDAPVAGQWPVSRGRAQDVRAGRRAGGPVLARVVPHGHAWQVAAAAVIAVGGLSLAVVHTLQSRAGQAPLAAPGLVVSSPAPGVSGSLPSSAPDTTIAPAPRVAAAGAATGAVTTSGSGAAVNEGPGLAVNDDISELSDGDVETLLQDMSGLEAEPAADPDAAAPALPGTVSP